MRYSTYSKAGRWLAAWIFLSGCATNRTITEKPILFDEERNSLSLEYLAEHYELEQPSPTIQPRMVVLHYTVIPTMEGTYQAFYPPVLPGGRPEIQGAGNLNVSAHFLVDRDGTIYRLLPETILARHVIGLNHCAIGVENVGGTKDLPMTRAQVKANIWLVRYLHEKYALEYLIGHQEYPCFEGHELWLERDDSYRTIKQDPGKDFMRKVRRAFKNSTFKPVPCKNQGSDE